MQHLRWGSLALILLCFANGIQAQQTVSNTSSAVPALMHFSGVLSDLAGKPVTGVAGVTFSLYKDQLGGAPLWMETQNVHPDSHGHYNVMLGSSNGEGLPTSLFASGEARWLGVQLQGEPEQPRIMLLAVPYALKAADAQTVGGLPASAFVLAAPPVSATPVQPATSQSSAAAVTATTSAVTTTGGTAQTIPLFTTATNIQNSILSQTSTTAINVGGKLNLPSTGTATAAGGKNSRPETLVASTFNSGTAAAVAQTFQLQAEPANNNTKTPSGTLNLLYGTGTVVPAETGLKIASNGRITFAAGQTFPGTGPGTITGVTAGTDLTGGGKSGTVTLNLDTTKVPQLGTPNTFTQLQTINNQVLIVATAGGQALFAGGKGGPNGIQGSTDAPGAAGIVGVTTALTGNGNGVVGSSQAPSGNGGSFSGATGVVGVASVCCSGLGGAFIGTNAPSGSGLNGPNGVLGLGGNGDLATNSDGVGGVFQGGNKGIHGDAVQGIAGSGFAGNFTGDLNVTGAITAGTKDFKIDHPLDPANKYLVHASVESSEMVNVYTGNVTTDSQGKANVRLPDWFEALNADFRYQLTVIGQFAQAIVAKEIQNHQFQIRTNLPNVKVSWQVTGVRQDAFAKAHPLVVEQQKDARVRGFYIHPELYGAPQERQIEWARHPGLMTQMKEKQVSRLAGLPAARLASGNSSARQTDSSPR